MSALFGIYYLDGRRVNDAELERMGEALAHRGGEGQAVLKRGSVGFGHSMRWTTPESKTEKLPRFNAEQGTLITCDGRVDNRDELIAFLGLTGKKEEISDSQVILAAYERWGAACAKQILGDFAFVIWDEAKKELVAARDIFGVKPFYYYLNEKMFIFASEIKALLTHPDVPRKLNEIMVADHLLWCTEDKEITFYKDILRLPAARTMIVTPRKTRMERYWALDPHYELKLRSDEDYAERFRAIFIASVRARLRSAYPVGSLLSGGLDSSSIVCVARGLWAKKQRGEFHTFSAVFDDVSECDEKPFIRAVTDLGWLRSHEIRADLVPPFFEIDKIFNALDEGHNCNLPFLWGGVYPAAKEAGVRVLLDGDGGDEAVSRGYPHMAELFAQLRWQELWQTIEPLAKHRKEPPFQIFWQQALRPNVPAWVHSAWRMARRRGRPLWLDDTLLNPDFMRRFGIGERARTLLGYEMHPARTVREEHCDMLQSGPLAHTFEVINRVSHAHGIEHRYPFLDRRLVEFCVSLPSEQKLHRGWTRMVMRRAMKDILPEKIRWRGGKTYLDKNITHGLKTYERRTLADTIETNTDRIGRYVDLKALDKTYRTFLEAPDYASTTSVWQTAMFSLWLKQAALEP